MDNKSVVTKPVLERYNSNLSGQLLDEMGEEDITAMISEAMKVELKDYKDRAKLNFLDIKLSKPSTMSTSVVLRDLKYNEQVPDECTAKVGDIFYNDTYYCGYVNLYTTIYPWFLPKGYYKINKFSSGLDRSASQPTIMLNSPNLCANASTKKMGDISEEGDVTWLGDSIRVSDSGVKDDPTGSLTELKDVDQSIKTQINFSEELSNDFKSSNISFAGSNIFYYKNTVTVEGPTIVYVKNDISESHSPASGVYIYANISKGYYLFKNGTSEGGQFSIQGYSSSISGTSGTILPDDIVYLGESILV